ncbi:MAG: hypothetical protein AAGC70_19845 [Pseudomonadota bacterium]
MKSQKKCYHTLVMAKLIPKGEYDFNPPSVGFRGILDFVGVPVSLARSEIFDSACHGGMVHADLAVYYLKSGRAMSLNDLRYLHTYAIKHNKKELEKLITDAIAGE